MGSTGGGAGGGGGATCDGCYLQGSCLPRSSSNVNLACGQGGVQCATCNSSQTCSNYACVGSTGGGGGSTGGGSGTGGGSATGGGSGGLGEDCATPQPLSSGSSVTVSGTTAGALDDVSISCGVGFDRVYSFTTTSTQQIVANLSATGFQGTVGLMSLVSGSCTAELACGTATTTGGASGFDTRVLAGTWAVVVKSAGTAGSYSLNVQRTTPTTTAMSNGMSYSVAGPTRSYRMFSVTLPTPMTLLTVTLSSSTGDADLYGRLGLEPSLDLNTFDKSSTGTGTDTVTWTSPAAGTYYVMVSGYAEYTGGTINASWN